jgi:hypothetical protein
VMSRRAYVESQCAEHDSLAQRFIALTGHFALKLSHSAWLLPCEAFASRGPPTGGLPSGMQWLRSSWILELRLGVSR